MTPEDWTRSNVSELTAPGQYQCVGGPFGSNLSGKHYVDEPGVPVIRGVNLSGPGRFRDDDFVFVSEGKADELVQNLAYPGDLVFTQRGTLGQVGQIPEDAEFERYVVSQSQMKLTVDVSVACPRFLYHTFSSPMASAYLEKVTIATGVPHINLRILREWPVLLPPLSVQQRIAEILSTVDEAIEQTEALIAKTQQIKAGLMHDLFTRGVTPDGQLRPPREEAPQLYKESPLGWIPKEWVSVELGAVSEIVSGVTLSGGGPAGGIVVPYLRVANVQDGYLDLSEVKTVRVSQAQFSKLQLIAGDVLMNEGGDFDKLGRGTVWKQEIKPCVHQNHVFRVRPRLEEMRSEFLAYWSQSEFGKKYFVISSKQSTNLASINSTQLHRFPIAKPAESEQQRIEARLLAADHTIEALRDDLAKLQKTKAGSMHDLLTGRVPVAPAAADV